MGIRSNYPMAGQGWVGMVAVSCRPLDEPSSEVKNKLSYTSTAPNWPSFQGLTNLPLLPSFVVSCLRSLISKDNGMLLQFYDFVHHWSKLVSSKLTPQNLDYTFLRGSCTMDVNTTEWKCIFRTYFCGVSDAPRRHHIWSKPWWCVTLPCTQLWKNKT